MCAVFWTVVYFWLGIGYFWLRKKLKPFPNVRDLLLFLLLVWIWPFHLVYRIILWAKSAEGSEDRMSPAL